MERKTTGVPRQRASTSREPKRENSLSQNINSGAKLPDPEKIRRFLKKMQAKAPNKVFQTSLLPQPVVTITTEQAEDDQEILNLRNSLAAKTPTSQSRPNLSSGFSKFKFPQSGVLTPQQKQPEVSNSNTQKFLGKVTDWIEQLESSQPRKRGHSAAHSRQPSGGSQKALKVAHAGHPLASSTSHIKKLFPQSSSHKRDSSQSTSSLRPPLPRPGSLIAQGPGTGERETHKTDSSGQKWFTSSHRSSQGNVGFAGSGVGSLTREDIVVENELIRQKIAQLQKSLAKEALQRRFWEEKYHDLESKYNERIMNKVRNSSPSRVRGSSVDSRSKQFVEDLKVTLPTRATGDSSRKSR